MRFIVDTNILISGLIKDSVTRKILLSDKFEFYHPEILLEELNKHIPEIAKKARKDEKDINQLIKIFRENLLSVSIDEYEQNLDKANDIIGSIERKMWHL
jgi:predicted nucleic acid-binding protein